MAFQQNIVVTGVGVVSPIGIGKGPFWASLCEGRSGIRRLDFSDFSGGLPGELPEPPAVGGLVADFDPKQYVRPRKSLKVMSRDIQLAFAAADLACADAQLPQRPVAHEQLGVVFGASMIPCELDELVGAYRGCIVDGAFDFRRWGHAAMAELFPLWMLKYLPNMPACHIAIAQDARGPNNSITLGDVSSLSAMAEAARILDRGQAEAIIAGGVGVQTSPSQWIRSHLLGLSRRDDQPAAALRPFDATRDGLAGGEGAAALFLETESRAWARRADPRSRPWRRRGIRAVPQRSNPAGRGPPPSHLRRPARRRPDAGRRGTGRCPRPWLDRRRPHGSPSDPRHLGQRAGDGP